MAALESPWAISIPISLRKGLRMVMVPRTDLHGTGQDIEDPIKGLLKIQTCIEGLAYFIEKRVLFSLFHSLINPNF